MKQFFLFFSLFVTFDLVEFYTINSFIKLFINHQFGNLHLWRGLFFLLKYYYIYGQVFPFFPPSKQGKNSSKDTLSNLIFSNIKLKPTKLDSTSPRVIFKSKLKYVSQRFDFKNQLMINKSLDSLVIWEYTGESMTLPQGKMQSIFLQVVSLAC